eukprot:Amastigsp_a339346_5.p5 type:complete len:127 gc:universal Amastigsp_a339346_5:431-51(-)
MVHCERSRSQSTTRGCKARARSSPSSSLCSKSWTSGRPRRKALDRVENRHAASFSKTRSPSTRRSPPPRPHRPRTSLPCSRPRTSPQWPRASATRGRPSSARFGPPRRRVRSRISHTSTSRATTSS